MILKEIKSDIIEIYESILEWIFYKRYSIKIQIAIKLADMKQKAFNKRYFVVLVELPDGDKLRSINNDEFEIFKRRGWLPKRMSYLELSHQSFYQTSL